METPPLKARRRPLLWSEDEEEEETGGGEQLLSPSIIQETEIDECLTQPVQKPLEGIPLVSLPLSSCLFQVSLLTLMFVLVLTIPSTLEKVCWRL